MPADGVFKVESTSMGMLAITAGELLIGIPMSSVEIVQRNMPEPPSWLPHEVQALRKQVELCPCNECEQNLRRKEQQLSASLAVH